VTGWGSDCPAGSPNYGIAERAAACNDRGQTLPDPSAWRPSAWSIKPACASRRRLGALWDIASAAI